MTETTDFDALEASLSDRERGVFNRLKQSYREKMDCVENPDEKARKAALLAIKQDRTLAESLEQLMDGINSPEESSHSEVVAAMEADVEATREHREFLEEIGVYPVDPPTD